MIKWIHGLPENLGYPDPQQFLERAAYLAASGVCGTVIAKIFVPTLNLKSHFVFGQVSILTFSLFFFNENIKKKYQGEGNTFKKDVIFLAWGSAYTAIPVLFSKVVVSRWIEPLSFSRYVTRGLYYAIFSTASSYAYYRHRRDQMRLVP